jgi:hypothetical protein
MIKCRKQRWKTGRRTAISKAQATRTKKQEPKIKNIKKPTWIY